jgi:signal transduction histidine kinase/ligand-binding sensor domain-containing protein
MLYINDVYLFNKNKAINKMKSGIPFRLNSSSGIALMVFLFVFQANFSAQSQLRFEHINKKDGLSQGTVNAILQDNNGLMWFGTNDGLNRYDGKNMIIYRRNHADKSSLPNNNIISLGQDASNRLWVGTMGSGIFYLDPVKNTFHSINEIADSLQNLNIGQNVYCIFIDTTNNVLWAGTNNGIISVDFGRSKMSFIDLTVREVDGVVPGNIYSLLVEDEVIWIGSDRAGLIRMSINSDHLQSYPIVGKVNFIDEIGHRGIINTIIRDKTGKLWVATFGNGVMNVDEQNHNLIRPGFNIEFKHNSFTPFIRTMALVGDTSIWCATTGGGLQIIDLKKNKITLIETNNISPGGLSSLALKSVYADLNGGVWIGDNGLGINYYFPVSKNIMHLRPSSDIYGLTFQSVRSIYRDENKNIWVGGYGGFNVFDSKFKRIFVNKAIGNAYYISPDEYDKEIVWIGSEGNGLRKFNKKEAQQLEFYSNRSSENEKGIVGSGVYSILDRSEEEIWIGTETALNIFNKKTAKSKALFLNNLSEVYRIKGRIRVIYTDSRNRIWVGTLGGGLSFLDSNLFFLKKFNHDSKNLSSISSDIIYSVYEAKNGVIFIGTDSGLNIYDEITGTFKHINTAHGLINDVVYGILEDEENNIWLSTNEGISCYNPSKGSFRNYTLEDGLQANEFNSGAYYKDDEGTLYFGGVNGVSIFKPEDLNDNPVEPKIVFTQLKIGNIPAIIDPPITNATEIKLDYFNQSFRLEFAALNFYKPKKNQYAYRIKEIRGDWTYLGNENSIEIANLGYGTFTIEVIASNNDGVWNEKGISLNVIINPPFWATFWFRLSFIFFTSALLSLFFYFRIRGLKRNKKRLEKEVDVRTKELQEANLDLMHEIKVRKRTEEELNTANQTKDKFFSIIAHDLKNPFNVMLGLTELLYEDFGSFTPKEQKELLQTVGKSTRELYNLLENLLSWSLAQRGKIVYTIEKIDLSKIVNETVFLLSEQVKQKNIELQSAVSPGLAALADKNSISTVLRNFISNAIKFTPLGGSIIITSDDSEAMISISVSDTGVGISEENIQKLFRIDEQFKTTGTAKEKGTGLGLVLCSEFIQANGGAISVKSKLGKGSTFSFSLPKAN